MKKLPFYILFICSFFLSACSAANLVSSKTTTSFPEDLVVVLPDGQELSLYMPHADAAEILGPADSFDDDALFPMYHYEDLQLDIGYNKDDYTACIILGRQSPCTLKNGIGPSSKKSDFIEAGFSEESSAPLKFYTIDNGHYTACFELPKNVEYHFQEAASVSSPSMYTSVDQPIFKGFLIYVSDHEASMRGWN